MTQTNPETIATGAARLRAKISGHLASVTISYPERHNIIDLEGWLAFPDLMARLADNSNVRLIVLRGDGDKAFVAGADIAQFAEKFSGPAGSDYDAATVNAFNAVSQVRVPTLAAIQGYCIGGGLGLSLLGVSSALSLLRGVGTTGWAPGWGWRWRAICALPATMRALPFPPRAWGLPILPARPTVCATQLALRGPKIFCSPHAGLTRTKPRQSGWWIMLRPYRILSARCRIALHRFAPTPH